MKHFGMIFGILLTICLTALSVTAVEGRTGRKVEVQNNLATAVEDTLTNMALTKKYSVGNVDEYLADFTEDLACSLDTKSDLKVEVSKADMEKGVLSIKVTEKFKHPNGNEGSVSLKKTVILDKEEQEEKTLYTVNFYLSRADALPYKTCRVLAGDTVSAPADPASETGNFIAWKDGNGYLADFTQPVVQDLCYYAEFN